MPANKQISTVVEQQKVQLSPEEKQERKQQVLTQEVASITQSITDAVVIKSGNVYFLTRKDGDIPIREGHGYGLYYKDCRYLNGYELRLAENQLNVLVSSARKGFQAIFEMTNPDIDLGNGNHLGRDHIGVTWERFIDGSTQTLYETISIQNYGLEPQVFPLSLTFHADFEDIFAIRGLLQKQPGKLHPPTWKGEDLYFFYDDAAGLYHSLTVNFSPAPDDKTEAVAGFNIHLQPLETKNILVSMVIAEASEKSQVQPEKHRTPDLARTRRVMQQNVDEWMKGQMHFNSDSLVINNVMGRSLQDLRVLRSMLEDRSYFAAGVPWFVTLFGRDAIITAIQTLAFNPQIAAETLRLLAHYQAQTLDEWRDAEPGKILHELRVGELARLGAIPHTPYYGTVDATPLFLVLLARHAAWTGDLSLFQELRSSVDLALSWMSQYGDRNGDGYIEYESHTEHRLINQGWKDSGNAIVTEDGTLAQPPISLVEVQGYAYMAKMAIAGLYEREGEASFADQLRQEAENLGRQFNQDFWSDDLGTYVLALQAGGKPAKVTTSNPGHALWAGIAEPEKARRTAERLMAPDMFSGWGIRTLSSREKSYNPIGYHLGSVWPHDNSIIAAGFRRYGFDEFARKILNGIVLAAMNFETNRLPELFSGFDQDGYDIPVPYPVACHPQAWAAGSVPYMIENMLGLQPNAFENCLRIVRPMLPDFTDHIEIRGLHVGDATLDLNFERALDGRTAVHVARVTGDVDVIVALKE